MVGLTTESAGALVQGAPVAAPGMVLAEILAPCNIGGEHVDPAKPGADPVLVQVSPRDLDNLVETGRGRLYTPPAAPVAPAPEASAEQPAADPATPASISADQAPAELMAGLGRNAGGSPL